MKSKYIIIFAIVVSVIAFLVIVNTVFAPDTQDYETGVITINEKIIKIEIAQTQSQQVLGLGNRDFLAVDSGMLFLYDNYGVRRFWMKGMRFPLDIIWISDNVIVGIESNVPVPENDQQILPAYTSPQEVNYVLEVNAGYCETNDIRVGDKVILDIN